jgi:sugar phosphate isomerase/epimerase
LRLGISADSYIFTRGFIPDSHLAKRKFEYLDMPLRYYDGPTPVDFMLWLMERGKHYRQRYGLRCLPILLDHLDSAYLEELKRLFVSSELLPSYLALDLGFKETGGDYFVCKPGEFKEAVQRSRKYFKAAKALGVKLAVTGNPPYLVGRFRKDIPLEKQLERYAGNLKQLADAAAEFGVTLAIENTGDYRVGELIKVIKRCQRDDLMLAFDTGNTMLAVEDPVEAARQASPYAAAVHMKDNFFQTVVWYGAKIFGTPVGGGHVDFAKILELLQRGSPDAKNLPLDVEVMAREGDEDELVEQSLQQVRQKYGEYIA